MLKAVYIYYITVNFVTFLIYGADKFFAKKKMWRISEKVLLTFAAVGGAIGALCAMEFFRHKTKHVKFKLLVPAFMLVHIGIWIYIFMP